MKSSTFPFLFGCLLAVFCPAAGYSQFLKNVIDNVKNTVQNRANSKASQTTNNVLDKVDPTTGKPKTAPSSGSGSTPANGTTPANGSSPASRSTTSGTSGGSSGAAGSGKSGSGGSGSGGNTDSDSSFLVLNLSAGKILLEDAVIISGNSIKFQSLKDVTLLITGPSTSVSKTLPLSDSGTYKTTWHATLPGNYIVTVKSSNNKSQKTATLDVYRVVDIDSIINDDMTGVKKAFDNLEKQVDAMKGNLGPTDAQQLQKGMDKVTKQKDQVLKLFTDLGTMGKGLDGIEKQYGGLPPSASDDLAQLGTMLTNQAQQVSQANAFYGHNKSYDNTICEMLVMVSEVCAAFSTFTNVWAQSAGAIVKNIAIDKGGPGAMAATGTKGGNNDIFKELFKVTSSCTTDLKGLQEDFGPSGIAGDLVQMCSNYFLKKYCAVLSGDLKHDYKCTFRNKAMVDYWDYSYTTEATISLRYPKSGSQGRIIKMKGNIEGNATKFTIYQKATEQDDFKDAKGYRASLFSICLWVPPSMPFSSSKADRNAGFGAVARAVATPSYFNIPIDAEYDTETGKLKMYCNDALVDFSDRIEYVYGYIALAAGLPLVARVTYPINKAKLTLAKVIEKNNDFTVVSDSDHNLSITKDGNFKMGTGSVLEHNINFSLTLKTEQ